jgi:uncharacterized paraquat-inducible protein A
VAGLLAVFKLTSAWEIVAIFALMFTGVTVATLWFAHSSEKMKSKKEIQKKKIEVIDKHFHDMIRIECPYCKTIYKPDELECPNCKAKTKSILFPEMPE